MSTELVETSRLWARYSAQIDPAWAEPLAGALTRTTYADPHWSGSRGSAVASAKVLLYGLPIVQDRTVQWGRINPLEARDFLIRQGLVEGDIQQRFSYDDFVTRNRDILEDAADDASRTRQVAQTVGDEDLFDFYNAIIPNTESEPARRSTLSGSKSSRSGCSSCFVFHHFAKSATLVTVLGMMAL